DLIPSKHWTFLGRCRDYFMTRTHFFTHANYRPERLLTAQDSHTLRWLSLRDYVPGPHHSGRTAIVGHMPQPEVLDLGYLKCIDTGCCTGGWLTALEVQSGQIWQVDERAKFREELCGRASPDVPA